MPDVQDLYIDPTTDDLSLDGAGNILSVTGAERIAQHVRSRLLTRRGEWYLDETVGVPYLEQIFVKAPDLVVIRASVAAEILDVPGVARITRLDLTFTPGSRTLTMSFEALTDDGTLIGGTLP